MRLDAIAILLNQAIGLDAGSIGRSALERAVRQRAEACGLGDAGEYAAHVSASRAELRELIEAVVVPETWFFRDRAAFAALGRMARSMDGRSSAPLRLLSIPCATGEEPYSMAMSLIEAGVPSARIQIEAADISARSLAKARRGAYRSNSFRGDAQGFRDRYFEKVSAGHRIVSDVRRLVTFSQANLVPGEFPEDRAPYDFIFCRNALIYFDARTQQAVLGLLRRLLKPQGVLFVGPAESGRMTDGGFISAQIPKAFAYRRAAIHQRTASPQVAEAIPVPGNHSLPTRPRTAAAVNDLAEKLRFARELADRARFSEAAVLCESLLAAQPANADVLCLLGLVRDAEGDAEAARELYRKALYLDPHHAEALAHLALLNGQSGRHESARLLHRRAVRVREKLLP